MNLVQVKINYQYFNDELTENYVEQKFESMYKANKFNKEVERDLFVKIMDAKIDGMTLDVHSFGILHSVDIHLFYSIGTEIGNDLVEVISHWCDENFEPLDESENQLSNHIRLTEDGVLVQIDDIFDTDFIPQLSDEFDSKGISFDVIGHRKQSYERGAGDYREQLLLFVRSSIESGIAWDGIKFIVTQALLSLGIQKSRVFFNKSFDSEVIISMVADRINENPINISITDINTSTETGLTDLRLQTKYSVVHLTCGQKNNITKFEVRNHTKTKI